jgi:PAS domain S-box-containing protein
MTAGRTEEAAPLEGPGLLSAIVEGTPDAVFVKDLEGRYLMVNSACARILGRPKEEIVGRDDAQILPSETAERLAEVDRLVMDTGEASSYEEVLPVGGRPRTFLSTKSVHRDAAGTALGIIGISRDITERKEAERAQRFLAEVGEMLSTSLDYRATLASVARLAVPTLADWCGVDVLGEGGFVERLAVAHEDPEKVPLALKLQERYPADPEAPGGLHNVLRTGRTEVHPEVTDAMLEATARDEEHLGLLREIGFRSVIIVPMVTRGRTLGAVTLVSAESGRGFGESDVGLAEELARRAATAVDNAGLYEEAKKEIVEREWAQGELRASRDQLEVVLRGVADGVTAQDASGNLIYANEAAARLVGYPSAREFMEAPVREVMAAFEVFDEEGRTFSLASLPGRRALSGEEGAEEVLRFRGLATGEERWSVVKAEPVFDERGKVRVAVSIFRDVTESRRAEEAMREVREAERARMARDLHDGVLQDLSYTAASMGVMMLDAKGTEQEGRLQGTIDAVRRAAQGMREAVNDLRIEEEMGRFFPELVGSLVEEARAMDPGCEYSLEVREGVPRGALGEAGVELSRVIREALTNARRHSGARSVEVALLTEGDELVAEVSDDGRGFGPRAEPGTGSRSMRERARRLGGELAVESAPGAGTLVRAMVPMPAALRGAQRDQAGPDGPGR